MSIVIEGWFGIGYAGNFDFDGSLIPLNMVALPHKAMKQIVIEEVAIKAGLVQYVAIDSNGAGYQNTKTNLSTLSQKALDSYVLRVVV